MNLRDIVYLSTLMFYQLEGISGVFVKICETPKALTGNAFTNSMKFEQVVKARPKSATGPTHDSNLDSSRRLVSGAVHQSSEGPESIGLAVGHSHSQNEVQERSSGHGGDTKEKYETWHADFRELKKSLDLGLSAEARSARYKCESIDPDLKIKNPLSFLENAVVRLIAVKDPALVIGDPHTWLALQEGPEVIPHLLKSFPNQVGECLAYLQILERRNFFLSTSTKLLRAQKLVLGSLEILVEHGMIERATIQDCFMQDESLIKQVGNHLVSCFFDGFNRGSSSKHAQTATLDLAFRALKQDLANSDQTQHIHAVLSVFETPQWKAVYFPFLTALYERMEPNGGFQASQVALDALHHSITRHFYNSLDHPTEPTFLQTIQDMMSLLEDPDKIFSDHEVGIDELKTVLLYILSQVSYVSAYGNLDSLRTVHDLRPLVEKLQMVKDMNKAYTSCTVMEARLNRVSEAIGVFSKEKKPDGSSSQAWNSHRLGKYIELENELIKTLLDGNHANLSKNVNFWLGYAQQNPTDWESKDLQAWIKANIIQIQIKELKISLAKLKNTYRKNLKQIQIQIVQLSKKPKIFVSSNKTPSSRFIIE